MESVVVLDRTNFRKICKDSGVTPSNVLFNRITWRLAKLEQLEDVGMANCDAAIILRQELDSLFDKLAMSIKGEANV